MSTRIKWAGHPDLWDSEDIASLQAAEKASGQTWAYWQGGYTTRVPLSQGYHSGGGVVDLVPKDGDFNRAATALGQHGWKPYIRRGTEWAGNEHIHAVRPASTTLSAGAKSQATNSNDEGLPFTSVVGAVIGGFFGGASGAGVGAGAGGVVGSVGGAVVDAAGGVMTGIDAIGGFFGALAQRGTWVRVLQVVGGAGLVIGGVVIVGKGVIADVAVQAIPGAGALKAATGS